MENNKKTAWIWGVVIVVVILGLVLIAKKEKPASDMVGNESATETTSTGTSIPKAGVSTGQTVPPVVKTVKKPTGNLVELTNDGFSPFLLEIKRGESVEFLNSSNKAMVIHSDESKPENVYPGFSQESGPLGKGGKFFLPSRLQARGHTTISRARSMGRRSKE